MINSEIKGSSANVNLFLIRLNYSKRSEIQEINKLGQLSILNGIAVAINGKTSDRSYNYYQENEKSFPTIIDSAKKFIPKNLTSLLKTDDTAI